MMMRRVVLSVLVLLFGIFAGSEVRAQADAVPGFYVRGQLGYGWPSYKDLNSQINGEADALNVVSSTLDWEELLGAVHYSGEFGFSFNPVFSLGLGLGYQRSSRDHKANILFNSGTAIVSGTIEQPIDANLFTVMLVPTVRVASAPGLHFGAQVGLGRARFRRNEASNLSATDGTFVVATLKEEYDQTAFAGGLFAGYDIPVSPGLAFSMRAGYLLGNFSKMEGTFTSNATTDQGTFSNSGSATLTDSSGNPLELSFSGINLNIGVLWQLPYGP